jgi:cell wall-associated NlpC family hydrolase
MAQRRIADLARDAVALTLVVALFSVVPVYAAGPAEPSVTPTAPPIIIGDTPSSATPSRPDPEPSVIGDTGVDTTTLEFRRQLAARQARLDAFMAQLDELDRELAIASESYNEASDRLASMKDRVANAEKQLGEASTSLQEMNGLLNSQIGTIYRAGTYSPVEMLLDSKSLRDFVARVKFLNTVGTDSAEVVADIAARQADLEEQVFQLKNAKRLAEALEFELKARKIEVQLRIEERQQMFAATQSDLLALLDVEAARRQTEEAALLREILDGVSKAGIRVQPGSPVETALAYHGIPYLWGGATPSGFDCSGLVLFVFAQHGVVLPHYSGSQFLLGEKISPAELQPGDVVFFGSPIHHVGMYIGGGYFLHAPRTGDYVKISLLADRTDYAGARRYSWTPRLTAPLLSAKSPEAALSAIE